MSFRGNRLFAAYILAGIAAICCYQLLNGAAAVVLYGLIGFSAVCASVVGACRHPLRAAAPRLLVTAGLALLVSGDLEWYAEDLLGHTISIPSVSDVLYLCAYPVIAIGLLLFDRRRSRAALADSVIVTVALATILWSPLFASFRASSGHPMGERLTLGAYPIWDLLLFLLATHFTLGRAIRTPWRVVLTAGIAFVFAGDVLWAASADTYALGNWVDTTWLVGYTLVGASALHRSAQPGQVSQPSVELQASRRFALLAVPVAFLPVVLTVEILMGHRFGLIDVVLCSLLLLLLLARLGAVVRSLDHAKNRFTRVFADAPAGMAIVNADGVIVSVNAALCSIARVRESDIVGSDFRAFVEPGDRAEYEQDFAAMVARGELEPVERRFVAADGSEIWTLLSVSSLRDSGSPMMVAHVQDVTEARGLQIELAERNRQLEEADRLKDELVQVVSHDLRTPLTSIMGYLELALEEGQGEVADERRDYLLVAQRNSARLYRLVEDLLFVSRVKSGRPALELEDVDLAQIAREAVEMALPHAVSADIELALDGDVDAGAVADPHRISEAIENLLTNAIKFTPPGGRVAVRLAADDDTVTIRVVDTGIGVSPEDIGHLFDRFFRAGSSEAVPGAGLGLSIVQAIVEAHAGTIDVRSAPGAGTTFELCLPRRQAVAGELEAVA